ncbi:MAG: hypothetical protein HOL70_02245 [Candidatus Marinimicrobia bacterium]|nr:hypothetical protein [Candidatus Neomarinimicrobiota bacterium]
MKKKVVGSRAFTKKEVTVYEGNEWSEYKKENPLLGIFEEKILLCKELAQEVLKDPKFPQYSPIYLLGNSKTPLKDCPLHDSCPKKDNCPPFSFTSCPADSSLHVCYGRDSYLKTTRSDADADSPEMLAVTIMDYIKLINKNKEKGNNSSNTLSFALGVHYQQLKTVLLHSRSTKNNASRSRKKSWATSLAKQLTLLHPGKKFPFYWSLIPKDESNNKIDGYEVYRTGNTLYGVNNKEHQSISKKTFRTEYIGPQKKK